MFPWASVAVKVRVSKCSPWATSRAKSSDTSKVMDVQLSVATAKSKECRLRTTGSRLGAPTKVGGVVSETPLFGGGRRISTCIYGGVSDIQLVGT